MRSGIQFKQRDVVIVPFPFSDLTAVKRRPVLVLSNDEYNTSTQDMIVCAMTSNLKNSDYSILISNDDLESGSIPAPSRVKMDKLFTIEQDKAIKKVAIISKSSFDEVKKGLKSII